MKFNFQPFALQKEAGSLAAQLAEKIERAVQRGILYIGDRLPTVSQWAAALETSEFVPRRAMEMLARRGVLDIRRHVGAVVTGRHSRSGKGRVAFLSVDNGCVWAWNVFSFRLGVELHKAGYSYTHISLPGKGGELKPSQKTSEDYDLSVLEDAIRDGIDFAWCFSSRSWVTNLLNAAKVPFAVSGYGRVEYPGALDVFSPDTKKLTRELVARLKAAKCRTMTLVGPGPWVDDELSAHLYSSDIGFSKMPINPRSIAPEWWQRTAMEEFDRKLAEGREWLPDAFLFVDYYIAAGALLALTRHGIEAPRDVKVVVFSNKGLGPVYFKPLARFENDPERNAREAARYVIARLKGVPAHRPSMERRFISGRTL